MNTEKRRLAYTKVKNYVKNRPRQLRFQLHPNLERSADLRDDLAFLSKVKQNTLEVRDSDVLAERFDSEKPYFAACVKPDAFWDLLYSDAWSDCSSLRVCEGALLSRLLEELCRFHRKGSLHTYRMARFDHCEFETPTTALKTRHSRHAYVSEPVKINFTYYGDPKEEDSETFSNPASRSASRTWGSSSPRFAHLPVFFHSGSSDTSSSGYLRLQPDGRSVDVGLVSDDCCSASMCLSHDGGGAQKGAVTSGSGRTSGAPIKERVTMAVARQPFKADPDETELMEGQSVVGALRDFRSDPARQDGVSASSSRTSAFSVGKRTSVQFRPSHESICRSPIVFVDDRHCPASASSSFSLASDVGRANSRPYDAAAADEAAASAVAATSGAGETSSWEGSLLPTFLHLRSQVMSPVTSFRSIDPREHIDDSEEEESREKPSKFQMDCRLFLQRKQRQGRATVVNVSHGGAALVSCTPINPESTTAGPTQAGPPPPDVATRVHPDRAALAYKFGSGSRAAEPPAPLVLPPPPRPASPGEEDGDSRPAGSNQGNPNRNDVIPREIPVKKTDGDAGKGTRGSLKKKGRVVKMREPKEGHFNVVPLNLGYSIDNLRLMVQRKKAAAIPVPTLSAARRRFVEDALEKDLGAVYRGTGLVQTTPHPGVDLSKGSPPSRVRESGRQGGGGTAPTPPPVLFPRTHLEGFRKLLLTAARDFLIRKEQVTCTGSRATITSLTFNRITKFKFNELEVNGQLRSSKCDAMGPFVSKVKVKGQPEICVRDD